MITLRITSFKNQIKNWQDFFLMIIVFIPFMIYAYVQSGTDSFIFFYAFIGIQFTFTAYLHIRYYFENKGETYEIYDDKIIKSKGDKSQIIYSTDIKNIVICRSANTDKWSIPQTTFETFRIARIYLNNGEHLIMTNLLEYNIDRSLSILKNVKFERRKGFSFFI